LLAAGVIEVAESQRRAKQPQNLKPKREATHRDGGHLRIHVASGARGMAHTEAIGCKRFLFFGLRSTFGWLLNPQRIAGA